MANFNSVVTWQIPLVSNKARHFFTDSLGKNILESLLKAPNVLMSGLPVGEPKGAAKWENCHFFLSAKGWWYGTQVRGDMKILQKFFLLMASLGILQAIKRQSADSRTYEKLLYTICLFGMLKKNESLDYPIWVFIWRNNKRKADSH